MTTFNEEDMYKPFTKYQHSVLEVCGRIHGAYSGTGDAIPDNELDWLIRWLEWRSMDAWDQQYSERLQAYDDAVWTLARAAIYEGLDEQKRRTNRT